MNNLSEFGIDFKGALSYTFPKFNITNFQSDSKNPISEWINIAQNEKILESIVSVLESKGNSGDLKDFALQLGKLNQANYVRSGSHSDIKYYEKILKVWQKKVKSMEDNKLSLEVNERQLIENFLAKCEGLSIDYFHVFKEEGRLTFWVVSDLVNPDEKLSIYESFNEVHDKTPEINYELIVFSPDEIANIELPVIKSTYRL